MAQSTVLWVLIPILYETKHCFRSAQLIYTQNTAVMRTPRQRDVTPNRLWMFLTNVTSQVGTHMMGGDLERTMTVQNDTQVTVQNTFMNTWEDKKSG